METTAESQEVETFEDIQLETIRMKWVGMRPLIMNNPRSVDPFDEFTIQRKILTAKKGKDMTVENLRELDLVSWRAGVYWDDEEGFIIPSANLERAMQVGAQKSRKGKECQATVMLKGTHAKVHYKGPKHKADLETDPNFRLRMPMVIDKRRIMKVRPMIPTGWQIFPEFEFDPTVIDKSSLLTAAHNLGRLIGLGDWRPKFGRFLVEELP